MRKEGNHVLTMALKWKVKVGHRGKQGLEEVGEALRYGGWVEEGGCTLSMKVD